MKNPEINFFPRVVESRELSLKSDLKSSQHLNYVVNLSYLREKKAHVNLSLSKAFQLNFPCLLPAKSMRQKLDDKIYLEKYIPSAY